LGYRREHTSSYDLPRSRKIGQVLIAVLAFNLTVAGAKLTLGYFTDSLAIIADGWHSLFDGVSNVIGLVGILLASRPVDRNHPYGHSKYETYASVFIGGLLAITAWHIGGAAIDQLVSGTQPARVSALSFVIMLLTLLINIGVTLYERRAAKKLNSDLLKADSNHTFSDILVSLGVIAGLIAVSFGFPQADPLVALIVAAIIARTAFAIVRQAAETLSDVARLEVGDVQDAVRGVDGVLGAHDIRTRGVSSAVHVDLHIQVDGRISVSAGHSVAEAVEREICRVFPQVADVIVHLEPLDDYQRNKSFEDSDA